MFTRWLAGLLQHVYKVSCKACTTCLQGFVQGFYNMFNSVFKRCSQGVSQGCLKGVRKMFHTGVSQGFYNVFIRCAHEVFTVCLQEICAGGLYKAPQQCVYSTSTRVFCNVSMRRLYILQRSYTICTSVSARCLQHLYMCVLERCPQQLYKCFFERLLQSMYMCVCA
jgi:hypothetical protein